MQTSFHWLGVVYVLLTLIQISVLQYEDEEEEPGCPELNLKSVRVLCKTDFGVGPCRDVADGTRGIVRWRSKVTSRPEKGSTKTLVCRPPGEWKRERVEANLSSNMPSTTVRPEFEDYVNVSNFGSYKLHESMVNIAVANATCLGEKTRLFVVDSKHELKAVFMSIIEPKIDVLKQGIFLGVRQSGDRFYTEFGAPLPVPKVLQWAGGEPSMGPSEGCVCMGVPSLLMHDVPCQSHLCSTICERTLN